MKSIPCFLLACLCLLLTSCSSRQDPQALQTPSPTSASRDAIQTAATDPHAQHALAAPEPSAASALPATPAAGLAKELVCMVNNAYMGKKQVPVTFEDRLYYGCCAMCVNTIKTQRDVRVAFDPVTGKEVDKSLAFIGLDAAQDNGSVRYFESADTYRQYLRRSTSLN